MIKSDLVRVDGKLKARMRYIGTRIVCDVAIPDYNDDGNRVGTRICHMELPYWCDREQADKSRNADILNAFAKRGYIPSEVHIVEGSIKYETNCSYVEYHDPVMVCGHFEHDKNILRCEEV